MAGRHPLTAQTVKAMNTPGRYGDPGARGLYVLVGPGGSKSWVLRTLVKGQRRDIGLGGVELVTLREARDEAHRLRKLARAGGDPLADRRAQRRDVPTFETAAREVHTAHAASFKNDKHRKQWLSSLGVAFKAFGAKRVDAVTSADVLAALTPGWLQRPETSRRVLQRVRVVFEWCQAQGFCAGNNPTLGVVKALPKHRTAKEHHAALPYQQLPQFLQDLQASDAGEVVKLALELTVLCATRTNETLKAEWTEIDLTAKTWAIPGARMKSGVEHRIPLSPRCITLLERAQALSNGGPYVFPGRSPRKPLSNMALLMAMRRMGRSDITVHGFRSTFRMWTVEQAKNAPRAVAEAALAHTLRDKTEAAYNRSDLFARRRTLMHEWSRFATAAPATVVAMHRA